MSIFRISGSLRQFPMLLLSAFLLLPLQAWSAAGSLDTSFDAGAGASGLVQNLLLQPDGKMLIVGGFYSVNGLPYQRIARLNVDGSLDTTFTIGSGDTGGVETAALQADGKIVIGGIFTLVNGAMHHNIARLNWDGSLDASFNPGTEINGAVYTSLIQNDGKLLVGGRFTVVNGIPVNRIARLNPDGSLDTTFDPGIGPDNWVHALEMQPDGKILIGGRFNAVEGVERDGIARLNADGSLDTTFVTGGDFSPVIRDIVRQPDGKVLVGGEFWDINNTLRENVARLNNDGSVDTTFNAGSGVMGDGVNNSVYTMALQPDGKVLLGGWFDEVNHISRQHIARLNSDGSLDTLFDPGAVANDTVWSMVIQQNGRLLIGGAYVNTQGYSRGLVARISTGDADSDGIEDGADLWPQDPAEALDTDQDGTGNNADTDDDNDGVPDGNDNCPLNVNNDQLNTDGDLHGNVCDTDDDNDGVLDMADVFPLDNTRAGDADADGVDRLVDNCLGAANPDQRDSDGDGAGNACDPTGAGNLDASFAPVAGADQFVRDIAIQPDGKVLLGGWFNTVNNESRNHIARLDPVGALDTSFSIGDGVIGNVAALALQDDGRVLVGGSFATVNNIARSNIARMNSDGSVDTTFTADIGVDGYVHAIALQENGKLLVGGEFSTIGEHSRNRIARLNQDGSLDTTFNPGAGANDIVRSLAVQADGKVVVGGYFYMMDGLAVGRVTRLNTDGSIDTTFNAGTGANYYVQTVALQPDGKIIVAGSFTSMNGVARSGIARLNSNGSLDTTFNCSGPDIYLRDIALQADGKILVGGFFTAINGVSRSRIARLNSDGSLDTFFNPGTGANSDVGSIHIQRDGKVMIGGVFTTVNGVARNRIARISSGDTDGDGVEDAADAFSLDATETADIDRDGIGNNGDTDNDNDGLADTIDADDDGDHTPDLIDPDPLHPGVHEMPWSLDALYKGSTIGDAVY